MSIPISKGIASEKYERSSLLVKLYPQLRRVEGCQTRRLRLETALQSRVSRYGYHGLTQDKLWDGGQIVTSHTQ